MYVLQELLRKTIEMKASDLHLTVGLPPTIRCNGKLIHLGDKKLLPNDVEEFSKEILQEKYEEYLSIGEFDTSYSAQGIGRFRVNVFKQRNSDAIAIRVIALKIPTLDELKHPAVLKDIVTKKRGLVLVTGPTGSGKSTTLASLIDIINSTQERHIITLEDPIEYVHHHKKGIVNQREIGNDTDSFNAALRAALRQDPDVILVGEMRDPETVSIALTAAETGHLVFSTLHTVGSAKTIDRIVDMFPAEQQQQIRTQLSTVCEGVISQQLIKTIDGRNRVAALEVMVTTPAIRNLIRENKTYQIQNIIQTSSKIGMQSMDQELVNLFRQGKISKESVLSRCTDFEYTSRLVGGMNY